MCHIIVVKSLNPYIILIDFSLTFVLLQNHRNVIEPMILILVGNKVDLEKERAVSREEAFLYASSINGSYYETSAINGGRGIEEVFISTARGLLRLAENSDCSSLKRYESTDSILSFSELNGNFGCFYDKNLSYSTKLLLVLL